ncbi:MAG TPA: sigma-70 family RNA polymerase sigma factor [Candidatus Ruania gallistercoris]|uniref:Sigma-70 family RNA polymerase sigma factor n=1 Tax=Candidatus Ruania gallistercoris TaxID=2838746 RepID=A0A9D2J2L9_9MICO|nr:sigma-70 family RNA polymerase sigma factor [Candidatus Ruania gallistercoris]
MLRPVLRGLTRRERRIVHLRFVSGCTQHELGAALGVSQMQVSRLLDRILTKLRDQIAPVERAS